MASMGALRLIHVLIVFNGVSGLLLGPAQTSYSRNLGTFAPLNEHGFEQVSASGSKSAMKQFILRVLEASNLEVKELDIHNLDKFAERAAHTAEFDTLPDLKAALVAKEWVVKKMQMIAAKAMQSLRGVADKLSTLVGGKKSDAGSIARSEAGRAQRVKADESDTAGIARSGAGTEEHVKAASEHGRTGKVHHKAAKAAKAAKVAHAAHAAKASKAVQAHKVAHAAHEAKASKAAQATKVAHAAHAATAESVHGKADKLPTARSVTEALSPSAAKMQGAKTWPKQPQNETNRAMTKKKAPTAANAMTDKKVNVSGAAQAAAEPNVQKPSVGQVVEDAYPKLNQSAAEVDKEEEKEDEDEAPVATPIVEEQAAEKTDASDNNEDNATASLASPNSTASGGRNSSPPATQGVEEADEAEEETDAVRERAASATKEHVVYDEVEETEDMPTKYGSVGEGSDNTTASVRSESSADNDGGNAPTVVEDEQDEKEETESARDRTASPIKKHLAVEEDKQTAKQSDASTGASDVVEDKEDEKETTDGARDRTASPVKKHFAVEEGKEAANQSEAITDASDVVEGEEDKKEEPDAADEQRPAEPAVGEVAFRSGVGRSGKLLQSVAWTAALMTALAFAH